MPLPRLIDSRGTSSAWPWIAAFLPGIVVLAMLWPLRVPLPYLDGWNFAQQYGKWAEGGYSWAEFFQPHYVHQSAVGKVIYFAVLHWFGGNMALLPLVMWGIAAVITACVCRLAQPLWSERPLWGSLVMLLVGLTIFSAAQGEVWLWGFLFQNSIPGMCLALGLLLLSKGPLSAWRVLIAALLVVISIFSFGSGVLVGILFCLPFWHGMEQKSIVRRCVVLAGWLAFVGFTAWISLRFLAEGVQGTDPAIVTDRPLMRVQFTLILLAQMLGKGTVLEPHDLCTWLGAILFVTFVACSVHVIRRRHDRALVSAALPWITFSLFGLGSAMLICVGRSFNSLANSLDERYAALTLFFPFGAILLAAAVVRHSTSPQGWIGGIRMAAIPAFVVLLMAHAVNWEKGRHAMKVKHRYMEQERAMLSFVHVLPPDPAWMENRLTRQSAFRMAKYLGSKNRLRTVKFASDDRVSSFALGNKAPKDWARLDEPQRLANGNWLLTGIGGTSAENAADLILITAQPMQANGEEKIIALTAPMVPETIFEREALTRRYPEHHVGWKYVLEPGILPPGKFTIRTYLFEQDEQRLRPVEGTYQVGASSVETSLTTSD